ncbi:MAG: DUF134 domain-containing protein [archaeon]
MVRPRICRRVQWHSPWRHFTPSGDGISEVEEVKLTHEEVEALRLRDLEKLDQSKAAKKMDISQPTFHRLLNEAHGKVAKALVNGNLLKIEGDFKIIKKPERRFLGPIGTCICPKCKKELEKIPGVRCIDIRCPNCKATYMIRKN